MWFVNIDHWTLKLAYVVLRRVADDNAQVDIHAR